MPNVINMKPLAVWDAFGIALLINYVWTFGISEADSQGGGVAYPQAALRAAWG